MNYKHISRFALLLMVYGLFARAIITSASDERAPDLNEMAKQIILRTNDFRKEQKLPPLASDEALSKTAQDFAKFIVDTGKYGHQADGHQPYERAERHGYDYCVVLENLAYKYDSEGVAQEDLIRFFIESWKDSPRHRKNMLDPDVTQTGVAVMNRGKSYYCVVQIFGRPKSAMIEFEITNKTDITLEYAVGAEVYRLAAQQIRSHEICRDLTILPKVEGDENAKKFTAKNGDRFEYCKGRKGAYTFKRAEK